MNHISWGLTRSGNQKRVMKSIGGGSGGTLVLNTIPKDLGHKKGLLILGPTPSKPVPGMFSLSLRRNGPRFASSKVG